MSCKSLITFLFRWASDWLVLCSCVGISHQLLNVLCFDFWFWLWTVLRNIAIVLALDLCLDFGSDFVSVLMCWTLRWCWLQVCDTCCVDNGYEVYASVGRRVCVVYAKPLRINAMIRLWRDLINQWSLLVVFPFTFEFRNVLTASAVLVM